MAKLVTDIMTGDYEEINGVDNPDTYGFEDAYNHHTHKQAWRESIVDKYQSIEENQVWELVDLHNDNLPVISTRWVFKTKLKPDGSVARYKSRLVARGFTQKKGVNFSETFAPVAKYPSLRLLFAMAADMGWEVHQMDAKTAFLCSEVDTDNILLELPEGFEECGLFDKMLRQADITREELRRPVLRLKKALYGLKQSPRLWYKRLTDYLQTIGFTRSELDHSVWVKEDVMVAIYVDDILVFGKTEEIICNIKAKLSEEFRMVDSGRVEFFLGLQVRRLGKGFGLNQTHYIDKLLEEYGLSEASTHATPLVARLRKRQYPIDVETPKENSDKADQKFKLKKYQRALGSLMYLMLATRPDIAYAVSHLAQFCSNPSIMHWKAVKRLMRYLKATKNDVLWLNGTATRPKDVDVYGYTDADWASDAIDRKSCGAYLYFYRGSLVSWASKKQAFVATSTMEAEYVAASQAAKEGIWMREFVAELKQAIGVVENGSPARILKGSDLLPDTNVDPLINHYTNDPLPPDIRAPPVLIHVDNQAAIKVAANPEDHQRSKHIHISYHFLRHRVNLGQIVLQHVGTKDQIADYLTKPLSKEAHLRCKFYCGLKQEEFGVRKRW